MEGLIFGILWYIDKRQGKLKHFTFLSGVSFIEEKGLENGKNGFEGRPLLYNPNLFVYSWSGRFYFYWGKVREFLETDVCCNHYLKYSTVHFFLLIFLFIFAFRVQVIQIMKIFAMSSNKNRI